MGDWKEPNNIPGCNDLILHKMPKCEIPPHDYDNVFTVAESKQKYGSLSLTQLVNLLIFHCSEIESIRNKLNIGYYADSGAGLCHTGYKEIHQEDIKHLDGVVLREVGAEIKEVDFILSSPGGLLQPTFKLIEKIRKRFKQVSFLLPGSTYSGATILALSGDEIIFQSFAAHLSPINPRINGFDTYLGKHMLRTCKFYSMFAPWAVKHLPEYKIKANDVTKKTLINLEKLVIRTTRNNLAKYLFKVNRLIWDFVGGKVL